MAAPSEQRRLHLGTAGLACAVVALNLLYGAAERETVDSPPDLGLLAAGIAVALVALPLAVLAVRGPGLPQVLGWIAMAMLALCALAAAWVLALPAIRE